MANIGELLFQEYGLYVIIFAVVGAVCVWLLAHRAAAPGSVVSILWGLAKYKKRETIIPSESTVRIDSPAETNDADAVAAIRLEATELLKKVGSSPGGLWLMAEAITSGRQDLLSLADQLKAKYRAKALANLAYTLMVLGRPEDAFLVAERSLAAVEHPYTLVDLTEIFAKAKLYATALKAAEQAVAQAKAAAKTLGLSRLTRVLISVSSVNHALTVARGIEDPNHRSEALSAIVDELIKHHQTDEAGDVFQEALSASLKITMASDRASAIANRTRELSRLGRYGESRKLARKAKEEALKIDPKELFGDLTVKLVKSEMSLFERSHTQILQAAAFHKRPDVLVRLASSMPEGAEETSRVIESALKMATQGEDPVVLAQISNLLRCKASPQEGARVARQATEMALRSNNPRTRQATLLNAADVLARTGDFETAFAAVDGIDSVERGAKVMAQVLIRSYACKAKPSRKVSKTLNRAHRASDNLNDKDRSKVLGYLAVSQAMLGNYREAYGVARAAPLSGPRLAGYSICVFMYELRRSPDLEKQVTASHDEALVVMLAPVFAWDLVD